MKKTFTLIELLVVSGRSNAGRFNGSVKRLPMTSL